MITDSNVKADAAGAICADWSTLDFGRPTAAQALGIFSSFDWAGEILRSDGRESTGQDTTYPNITFRIGSEHISIDSKGDAATFDLEICLLREKRFLGLIRTHRFFEAKSASVVAVREALSVFYNMDSHYRTTFFANLQRRTGSAVVG